MSAQFQYILYTLKVQSELSIEGLPERPFTSSPDVSIKLGKVVPPPENLPNTLYKPSSVANQNLYYLEIEDIARYQINGKKEVIIDIYKKSTEKDAMTFFFDTILTVLLLKHHLFAFHATAIRGKNGAVLICAPAGGGKSTLATVLLNRGETKLIEDDRCLVHWEETNQQVLIKNHLPFMELWNNLEKMAKKSGNLKPLYQIRENIQKMRYDASAFITKEVNPVNKIYLISLDNQEDRIEQKAIKGIQKAQITKRFTHLNHLIPFVSDATIHFKYIAKMVTTIPVYHVTRSSLTSLKDFSTHMITQLEI